MKSLIEQIGVYNGWMFMSVFIWQMVFMAFADKAVRDRTHVTSDDRVKYSSKSIGILANVFWLLVLVYSLFLPLRLGTNWFYAGLIVFFLGVAVLIGATVSFMTTPVDQLIQKGVYKMSRHPMYLATVLVCAGTGVAVASWVFGLMTLILAVVLHFEAKIEENVCLELYPDAYKAYMQRVRRWVGVYHKNKGTG